MADANTQSPAIAACVAAMKEQTADTVVVADTKVSGDSTVVMLETGSARVPWRCRATIVGAVDEFVYDA